MPVPSLPLPLIYAYGTRYWCVGAVDPQLQARWERGDASPFVAAIVFREALERRLGEPLTTKLLGEGQWGKAFQLTSGRVLKLTRDASEAQTSNTPALRTGRLKHLVRVFDVFAFPRHELFGIVTERLTPLAATEAQQFDGLIKLLHWLEVDLWGTPAATIHRALAREAAANSRGRQILAAWQRFQLAAILTELATARIQFADYHSGNLMKRGATYVIIDLGDNSHAADRGVLPAI